MIGGYWMCDECIAATKRADYRKAGATIAAMMAEERVAENGRTS
jgi:hypothetical protein